MVTSAILATSGARARGRGLRQHADRARRRPCLHADRQPHSGQRPVCGAGRELCGRDGLPRGAARAYPPGFPRPIPTFCSVPSESTELKCGETRMVKSAADYWTDCSHCHLDPDHVRDRFQLPFQCPGDETGWALAGRRLAAVRDTAVRRRNARLRRALSDQLSRAAVTGGTATLRRPGIRDPLLQRRSVQPDGECRFRIFIRWCRDLCAAGELIGNRHGLRPLSFAEALRLGCQQVYERNRAAGSWPPGNSYR